MPLEFREELNVELPQIGPPRVSENIFEYEGGDVSQDRLRCKCRISDSTLVSRDALDFTESDGTKHQARWYPMVEIRSGRRRVMPTALETAMQSGASETGSANIAGRG